ncbi:hypothetical protein K8R78_02450 [bacterium]|nr:hypothetical protein [bacterium]
MRKLILLVVVVLASSVMATAVTAQLAGYETTGQLFFEDWDNPGNWDINTPPAGWVIIDGNAGGNTGWADYSYGSGNDDGHVARVTYAPDETNFDFEVRMDSISFDATGYTFINLNMDFVLDYFASCDIVFQILVSTDDWSSSDVALEHTYADGNIGAYDC